MSFLPHRLFRFALQSLWRNLWLTVTTVGTATLTVLSLSLLIAIHVGLGQVLAATQDRIDLTLHLYPSVTEAQANSLVVALHALPEVTGVSYRSREQVLADERAAGSPEVLRSLELLGDNPFGATVTLQAGSPTEYLTVIEELEQPQYAGLIEGQQRNFEENREFMAGFTEFSERLRTVVLIIALVFASISGLMMFNAIRVAIYTQREEIGIMRLVGADPSFIRGPLILEVILYAVGSVLLGGALFYGLLLAAEPNVTAYFGSEIDLVGYVRSNAMLLLLGQFLFIALLGLGAALLALRRYLRL